MSSLSYQSRRRALPPIPIESDSESRSTMDTASEPRRFVLSESNTSRPPKIPDPEQRSSGSSYSSLFPFHAFRNTMRRPKSAVSASANTSNDHPERERSVHLGAASSSNAAGSSASSSHHRSKRERITTNDQVATRLSLQSHSSRRHTQMSADESDKGKDRAVDRQAFAGPLGAAEFDRMRKEIDLLKKALHDNKKATKKQAKKIEELKQDLSMALETKRESEDAVSVLKSKCQQNEELISTIESTIQCQICMELPHRPFGLAPCGHVFCLLCLKSWFRKAPPSLDDMDMDPEELNSPDYVMRRAKSCPTCRSPVEHRPAPIFMIKAVASALMKSKAPLIPFFGNAGGRASSPPLDPECDPWEGIFSPSDEETASEDDEEGDLFMDAVQWAFRGAYPLGMGYDDDSDSRSEDDDDDDDEDEDIADDYNDNDDDDDSDEDEDEDEDEEHNGGRFVEARWEPPTVDVAPSDWIVDEDEDVVILNLMRRGCNWPMIQKFRMVYAHNTGIVAHVQSIGRQIASFEDGVDDDVVADGDRVFLGWNIHLDEMDPAGDFYIEQTLRDIREYPERWSVTPRPLIPNAYDAKKMVRADDMDDYVTTDTEVWLDAEDLD
ncbi:hypothetical protein BDQ17DRAFT_1428357 [Cyathus striatus]|nr:hypothetical protein BDQ17DRAFT_1428357 [Cyathus striatus]